MSRKDFILIAGLLDSAEGLTIGQNKTLAEHFADGLASTNSQFNRDLFIQAATGVVPVNARKARV